MVIHIIYYFALSLILCNESHIQAIGTYSVAMVLYFGIRLAIGHYRGYPILTKRQAIGLALLPLYGPLLSLAVIYLVQAIKYGR
jgi:hypothetical protein